MSEIFVTKANGEREPYDPKKLSDSISRVEVKSADRERIVNSLSKQLYQNIPTSEIQVLVEKQLGTLSLNSQARYQLKRAIMALGPTGYPFEVYVAELLKSNGYKTQVSQSLRGNCVFHEVDVLAQKDDRIFFVECKYHNQPGLRSDLKVALYVAARGMDLIEDQRRTNPTIKYGSWIFTNTKFSSDAISYAECRGLRLTGWGYPKTGSLQLMVERAQLYPVTVLQSLDARQIKRLLEANIVLVKGLTDLPNLKELLDLGSEGFEELRRECLLIEED